MDKPIPPAPFLALIVAKTRMKNGFCVGAIAQNGRSLRLNDPDQPVKPIFNHEYQIGDVWLIEEYAQPRKRTLPHGEDIEVLRKQWLRKSDQLRVAVDKTMPPVVGGIGSVFDGFVQTADSGRLYIGRQRVPTYSTQFWRPDRDLRLALADAGSFRYLYRAGNTNCFLSYVGVARAKAVLPAGTLVRLSLARWWPCDVPEKDQKCYLQVSGWFDEESAFALAGDIRAATTKPIEVRPQREPVEADLPHLLQTHFGFTDFRAYQREIIESVLARRDTSVIMATGAGKSLCYQLPALAFAGLTVVVSPLISLMQDQVANLQQYGIAAATLNGHTGAEERYRITRQIRAGQLKLLYLSPEKLVSPGMLELLRKSHVELLVVDEAHCVTEWGHDFRQEYFEIRDARAALGFPPILALTATATPGVRRHIAEELDLQSPNEFVAPFNRPNLFLAVQPRHDGQRQVLDFLAEHAGQSGIIYCSTQKNVNAVAKMLQHEGIRALPYHAGLDTATRNRNQWSFIHDEAVVMVATIAFGMGIDKPDVRFVLHYNLADSPESYYQQIGRAGRDGDRADCLLLHAPQDFQTLRFIKTLGDPEPDRAALALERLQHMAAWIRDFTCRRKWLLEYFGEEGAPDNCGMCDACVAEAAATAVSAHGEGRDDITLYAHWFVSCVQQVKEQLGALLLVRMLRGSRDKRLAYLRPERLPSFGVGRALSRRSWNELVTQFFRLGLVTSDQTGTVKLTARGRAVIHGEKVFGYLGVPSPRAVTIPVGQDETLFEKLRTLRRQLAGERGVPAFMIFSDRTLRDMAAKLPQTVKAFREIHGVGEYKSIEFGPIFMDLIDEHCNRGAATAPVPKPTSTTWSSPIPTTTRTDRPTLTAAKRKSPPAAQARRAAAIADLQAGKSVYEVAAEFELDPVTVLRYVYRHYQENGKVPAGISLPKAQAPSRIRDQVFALFAEQGTEQLGPLYWAMNEQVSYLDLDLLRLEYLQL